MVKLRNSSRVTSLVMLGISLFFIFALAALARGFREFCRPRKLDLMKTTIVKKAWLGHCNSNWVGGEESLAQLLWVNLLPILFYWNSRQWPFLLVRKFFARFHVYC